MRISGAGAEEGRRRAVLLPLLVVVVAAFSLARAGPASATETETFRFEPHPVKVQGQERRTFAFDVAPGDSVADRVRVLNRTDEARTFRLYAVDVSYDPSTGSYDVPPSEATPQAVGSWIRLERTELTLLPGTADVIGFTLERPPDAEALGYAAIVAEEVAELPEAGGIDIVYRLAILVRLDGEATGLGIADARIRTPIELIPSTGSASATVTNDTLQSVNTTVRFQVESLTGRLWPLDPVEVRLDPGESREVSQDWTTVPRWGGILRVKAEAHWEAGSVTTHGPRNAHLPLWLLALIIGLIGVRAARVMWEDRRRAPEALPRKRSSVDDPVDSAAGGRGSASAEAPERDREPALVP